MIIEFLESALEEFAEAAEYYDSEEPGLGDEFVAEVFDTIQRVQEFQQAWTSLSSRTRRCQTRRFPFGVIYQIRSDTVLIVSVMHMRRSPDSWKSRLPPEEV